MEKDRKKVAADIQPLYEELRQHTPHLGVFKIAQSLPNEGESAVENNSESRVRFCNAILHDLTGGSGRLPSMDSLDRLKETMRMSRKLMLSSDWIDSVGGVGGLGMKERVRVKKHIREQTAIRETLALSGIDTEEIDEDELFITVELAEAIHSTFEYLSSVDPKKVVDRNRSGIDLVKLGAAANYEWGDFFVKTHQRFGMDNTQTMELFAGIFDRHDMSGPFRSRGSEHFIVGINGLVRTFLILDKAKRGEGEFRVGTVEEDTMHGVDLAWTDGNLDEYYEVKTTSKNYLRKPAIVSVTSKKGKNWYEDFVNSHYRGVEARRRLGSMDKLADYVEARRGLGESTKGFVALVPIG